MLKANIMITLIAQDYKSLFMHVDAEHRQHVPRPDFAPANTVLKQTHLVTQIFTSNPNPPHEAEKKMPEDVIRISRKIALVKPGVTTKPEPDAYHHLEPVGSVVYDIIFDAMYVGYTCYLMTCYQNWRGEEGPYSQPRDFIVI